MHQLVFPELLEACKAFSAEVTGVGLFSCMQSHVLDHTPLECECFLTVSADVWALTTVCHAMLPKVTGVCECLGTLCALEHLLTQVNHHVTLHMR